MFQCGGNVQNFSPDFLSSFRKTLHNFLESKIRAKTLSRDWFPHTLWKTTFEEEEEEDHEIKKIQMPGLTPASEQSFDFDDHAYAAAPGSHGGSVDGENAFVPPR